MYLYVVAAAYSRSAELLKPKDSGSEAPQRVGGVRPLLLCAG